MPPTVKQQVDDLLARNNELIDKYNASVERCNFAERTLRELRESKAADMDAAKLQLINERDFLRDTLAGLLARVEKIRKMPEPDGYRYR